MLSYFTFKGGFQDKMNLDFFFGSKSVEAWSGRVKGDEKSWSFFRGAKARLVVWWLCTTFLCSRDFIPQWSSLESYNYAGIKHLRMVFICHCIFIEFLVSWVGSLPEGIIWGVVFSRIFLADTNGWLQVPKAIFLKWQMRDSSSLLLHYRHQVHFLFHINITTPTFFETKNHNNHRWKNATIIKIWLMHE